MLENRKVFHRRLAKLKDNVNSALLTKAFARYGELPKQQRVVLRGAGMTARFSTLASFCDWAAIMLRGG
jgi:hypothetical protein